MIQQLKTKPTTTSAVIRSAAFVRGFNEVKAGEPIEYDAFRDSNKQWDYERGRLFGHRYHGKLKNGSKVNMAAALMLGVEMFTKSII